MMRKQQLQRPVFPAFLSRPLSLLPGNLHSRVFCAGLNYFFRQEILDNELDFLEQKALSIHVTDLGLRFNFSLSGAKIIPLPQRQAINLDMQGLLYDYLLMLSGEEDPDTLFFKRRLKLGGDTELGLYLKNFLGALEFNDKRSILLTLSRHARGIAERLS